MLHNKIYQNYFFEIIKTFITIVIGLSLIAFTVRAVNFLELIVDNGYSLSTYFKYSILNVFGIAPKFFPLAFLISIGIFLIKHKNNSELIILWTSGVKKIVIVNLLFFTSVVIMMLYLVFSTYLTPLALSKSRTLLSQSEFNSFLLTIRSQQFLDTFKGLTFFVDKKVDDEVEGIFLHDTGQNLNNFSSNSSNQSGYTTIIAEKGIVKKKGLFLINGQIINFKDTNKDKDIEVLKFKELNIDLERLKTTVIKKLKLQETPTVQLLNCLIYKNNDLKFCTNDTKKEIIPNLIRRIILPTYIPVIALICSFLLFKNQVFFSRNIILFLYSFTLLILIELILKYTGTNNLLKFVYIISPLIMTLILYPFLIFKLSR